MSEHTLYYTPPDPPNHAGWEEVHPEPQARVRRMRVPGGWLYQVEGVTNVLDASRNYLGPMEGWHPPVFVSDGAP